MTSHFVVSNICQEDPRRCGTGCHHGNYVSKEDWGCNTHGPLSSQLTFWQWSETSSTSQKVSGQAITHPPSLFRDTCGHSTEDGTTALCPRWSPFRNTTQILKQYVPANKCQTKTKYSRYDCQSTDAEMKYGQWLQDASRLWFYTSFEPTKTSRHCTN